MNIPMIGTIETGADGEPLVRLPEGMTRQAATLFWVDADEYIFTAQGELYQRVGEGDSKAPVLVTGDERASILSTRLGRIAQAR